MVAVPNFCPDVPALKHNPVFLYVADRFQQPNPFRPDVVVPIDPVLDRKVAALAEMDSQFFEWLPWIEGYLDEVPKDPAERKTWFKGQVLKRYGASADRFRDKLVELLGQEKGKAVQAAEAFQEPRAGTREPAVGPVGSAPRLIIVRPPGGPRPERQPAQVGVVADGADVVVGLVPVGLPRVVRAVLVPEVGADRIDAQSAVDVFHAEGFAGVGVGGLADVQQLVVDVAGGRRPGAGRQAMALGGEEDDRRPQLGPRPEERDEEHLRPGDEQEREDRRGVGHAGTLDLIDPGPPRRQGGRPFGSRPLDDRPQLVHPFEQDGPAGAGEEPRPADVERGRPSEPGVAGEPIPGEAVEQLEVDRALAAEGVAGEGLFALGEQF
ncbi:hypothetical protein HK102_011913, partial [Quaeritorhiza haematococci]